MKNIDAILNSLVASLLNNGSAEFSQDGLNIKTSYDNGCLSISASLVSPKEDKTEKLASEFETYIKSLSDDFFLEIVETFAPGELKVVQDKLDSKDLATVKEGITTFMTALRSVAASKIEALNSDIADTEKELSELVEIRDSYEHALNKKFHA